MPAVLHREIVASGACALFVCLALAAPAPALQEGTRHAAPEQGADACLQCHGDPGLVRTLPDGEVQSLFVDREVFARSVHGARNDCTGCHPGLEEIPHPAFPARSLREFRHAYGERCKVCHFDNYTKTLDGVHYELHHRGDRRAPLCVDCHGYHDMAPPNEPRSRISRTCSRCHRPVYEAYARSVHGKALLAEGNRDVPVCTDCHRSHDISTPRSREWHEGTPELCGDCHADPARMAKYGLSTQVLRTWLADFHGTTASLRRSEGADTGRVTASCIDCHGVHEIGPVHAGGEPVLKANLARTCRKCHPAATEGFPSAWLSHYEPTLRQAPLVFLVRWFYRLFIPLVVGGLLLQILLHLWRVVANR